MTFEAELANILNVKEKFAIARARGLKILPVCERCGGCGRYSFNQVDGDRCFGCDGYGIQAPKKNQQADVLAAAREAVESGENARYVEFLRTTAANKKARDIILKAWRDTGISEAYDWRKAADYDRNKIPEMKRDRDIADINAKMADAYKTVEKLSFAMPAAYNPDYKEKALELAAARDEALAKIAEAKAELDAYLAEKE